MTRVGLALGGGGAKGIAHIPILEAIDELGVYPQCIAGSSIGAIAGAIYASGQPAATMRAEVERLSWNHPGSANAEDSMLGWLEFLQPDLGPGGMLKADRFLAALAEIIQVSHFEELQIQLKVVATDFWKREEVVFHTGPIANAVRASMSLPGVFKPFIDGDRVLVDGSAVNPVPYDLLFNDCDLIVAVDVMGQRRRPDNLVPGFWDSLFNTYQIMQHSILTEKMKHRAPDIYVCPQLTGIHLLDFHKAPDIIQQAGLAKDSFKRQLEAKLDR